MLSLKKIMDNHINNNIYPFHMPGHKQNYNFFKKDFLCYDLTEFSYLDNLNDPQSSIDILNKRCSNLFKSTESFLLVNGSTLGILSAISSLCSSSNNPLIIASRNSHKSFFSALDINKCKCVYTYPKVSSYGIPLGVSPKDIDILLNNNPTALGVFITSPTYEGVISNIKEISKIVHKHNKILIVDEAHGGHFSLDSSFPNSANQEGSDITIQSLHKTLPALTQTAIIHINSKRVNVTSLKKYMYMLQTSSPSYLFLYTIDKLITDIEANSYFFENYKNHLNAFIIDFNLLVGVNGKITLLNKKFLQSEDKNVFDFDTGKLTFLLNCEKTGKDIESILRNDFNIQIEMSSVNFFLAMTSVCDTKKGFDLLLYSLIAIDKNLTYKKLPRIFKEKTFPITTTVPSTVIKNKFSFTKVHLDKSIGCVSKDFIVPYPPGIPIVVPDEIITKDIVDLISFYIENNINVIGIKNNTMLCLKN